MNPSHRDRIERMLVEGKITEDQFRELMLHVVDQPSGAIPSPSSQSEGARPTPLVLLKPSARLRARILAVLFVLLTAVDLLSRGEWPKDGGFGHLASIVLGFCLWYLKPWAYGILLLIGIANFSIVLLHGLTPALLIHAVLLGLLVSLFYDFFPQWKGRNPFEILSEWFAHHPLRAQWRQTPLRLRVCIYYVLIETVIYAWIGWVMRPQMIDLARASGKTLSEMTVGPFSLESPVHAIGMVILCPVLVLLLVYRVRWVYLMTIVCYLPAIPIQLLKEPAHWAWVPFHLAVVALFLSAWGCFFAKTSSASERAGLEDAC